MQFGRVYFDYCAKWDNLGLLGLRYELRCARICNGSQIKTSMEKISQKDGGIRQKQHEVHFSVHVFEVSAKKTQGFTSFDFILKETLFTFSFSKMCADGGTISFDSLSVQVFNSLTGKL